MSGVAYNLDMDVTEFGNKLKRLSSWDWNDFLTDAGAILESGARRRIQEEKQTPQGETWPQWSPSYAAHRNTNSQGNHSLLQNEGDLLDSLASGAQGFEAYAGSGLIYAATQFLGDEARNIPARQALGLSREDERDVEALGADYIERLLQ